MQKYKITVYYDMHTPWSGKTSYNLEKEKMALPTSAWFFLFVTVRSMLCCIDN